MQTLGKMPKFDLISWCGNFVGAIFYVAKHAIILHCKVFRYQFKYTTRKIATVMHE